MVLLVLVALLLAGPVRARKLRADALGDRNVGRRKVRLRRPVDLRVAEAPDRGERRELVRNTKNNTSV